MKSASVILKSKAHFSPYRVQRLLVTVRYPDISFLGGDVYNRIYRMYYKDEVLPQLLKETREVAKALSGYLTNGGARVDGLQHYYGGIHYSTIEWYAVTRNVTTMFAMGSNTHIEDVKRYRHPDPEWSIVYNRYDCPDGLGGGLKLLKPARDRHPQHDSPIWYLWRGKLMKYNYLWKELKAKYPPKPNKLKKRRTIKE